MTARSTVDTRKLDPTAIVVFNQACVQSIRPLDRALGLTSSLVLLALAGTWASTSATRCVLGSPRLLSFARLLTHSLSPCPQDTLF